MNLKNFISVLIILSTILNQMAFPHALADHAISASALAGDSVEISEALELGLVPETWMEDMSQAADFESFDSMITSLVLTQGSAAQSAWRDSIDAESYRASGMNRDDALILLLLAADAMGYTKYNARSFGFCTENRVDYDRMNEQLSWDYPYCREPEKEIILYFDKDWPDDPIGNVPSTALFWMQRRMDLSLRKHFLDCDIDLNFHLDEPLTRKDAVTAVIRYYNSETREYNYTLMRSRTEADDVILSEAAEKRDLIRSSIEEISCSGKKYYVSNAGDDGNNGLSPETAWATLERVNTAQLSRGDGVYFERGGLWRGQLWAQSGVIYTAYGAGEKPRIYGSPENGAGAEKWSLMEGTDNVWVYYRDMLDCGQIIIEGGAIPTQKISPNYRGGYLSTMTEDEPFDVGTELTKDLMFFSQADSVLHDGFPFVYHVMDMCDREEYPDVTGPLYLRCDAGNPGEIFGSIEFAVRKNLVLPADETTFHNLNFKYAGAHGIYANDMNIEVVLCEIGWIGGSPQFYDENGIPILMGNAVESDGSYDHFSVKNCYIYQCFDTAISNQDPNNPDDVPEDAYWDSIMRNISYVGNVLEMNDAGFEIFIVGEDNVGRGFHRMENVMIENNYVLYSGYGWYADIKKSYWGAAYQGHGYPNASYNFQMNHNVFYLSTGPLINTNARQQWLPTLDGNTYVQSEGGWLAGWPGEEGHSVLHSIDDKPELVIHDILGDEHGILLQVTPNVEYDFSD